MIIFLTGVSLGDLITSHDSEKQAQDGNSVTLYCNYTGAVYNLLWYRQYQRSKPELLLFMTESGDPVKEDPSANWLSAKADKHRKLMELEISPAKVSDSAQYYCALRPTVTGNPFPLHIILPMVKLNISKLMGCWQLISMNWYLIFILLFYLFIYLFTCLCLLYFLSVRKLWLRQTYCYIVCVGLI